MGTTVDKQRAFLPRTWEVPSFQTTILDERRHDAVVIIPVINEGTKLLDQLARIQSIKPDADVVIADGGSTDGSTEPEQARALGVSAILVKTGPGRLSAQLRMAYAWALERGYAHIVTIDGNGKDGVEAVPLFLDALHRGIDYAQGSRHVAGGEAINTPIDRLLANRLVHAPLVSIGAGRWFTDTTNGFRGYSSRALRDPRVAPFRDVFSNYSLLFYLSVRISRLGYKVTEIPVRRQYPATGKTPTKIAGLSARWALFTELLCAVAGRYNP